jgi:hypothetical protein
MPLADGAPFRPVGSLHALVHHHVHELVVVEARSLPLLHTVGQRCQPCVQLLPERPPVGGAERQGDRAKAGDVLVADPLRVSTNDT